MIVETTSFTYSQYRDAVDVGRFDRYVKDGLRVKIVPLERLPSRDMVDSIWRLNPTSCSRPRYLLDRICERFKIMGIDTINLIKILGQPDDRKKTAAVFLCQGYIILLKWIL